MADSKYHVVLKLSKTDSTPIETSLANAGYDLSLRYEQDGATVLHAMLGCGSTSELSDYPLIADHIPDDWPQYQKDATGLTDLSNLNKTQAKSLQVEGEPDAAWSTYGSPQV